jgi:hypothetical protein
MLSGIFVAAGMDSRMTDLPDGQIHALGRRGKCSDRDADDFTGANIEGDIRKRHPIRI